MIATDQRVATCAADGCDRTNIVARGFCTLHYQRFRKHGDVGRNDRVGARSSLAERFWRKVAMGDPDDCWEWQAARAKEGYGVFSAGAGRRSRWLLAHRVSWEITHGEIPDGDGYHGTCVCHHCDNPPCVNPTHLFLGSVQDNNADRDSKGRNIPPPVRSGEDHYAAKLTADEVRTIRSISGLSQSQIAAKFNVSRGTVSDIRRGKRWTDFS